MVKIIKFRGFVLLCRKPEKIKEQTCGNSLNEAAHGRKYKSLIKVLLL